mmetsp:Transcript_64984/g.174306  ORF Transcript_64984/g.174306 Transcript_64984/m.174306 type:complete len:242 (-) Transcript_64984:47-772(-)
MVAAALACTLRLPRHSQAPLRHLRLDPHSRPPGARPLRRLPAVKLHKARIDPVVVLAGNKPGQQPESLVDPLWGQPLAPNLHHRHRVHHPGGGRGGGSGAWATAHVAGVHAARHVPCAGHVAPAGHAKCAHGGGGAEGGGIAGWVARRVHRLNLPLRFIPHLQLPLRDTRLQRPRLRVVHIIHIMVQPVHRRLGVLRAVELHEYRTGLQEVVGGNKPREVLGDVLALPHGGIHGEPDNNDS